MKRLLFIFSVLACVLASCQKEMPSINGTKVTVSVGTDLTKTVLGENNGTTWPVLWQNGDKIDINGSESAPLAEGGYKSAEFSFQNQLTVPFKAAYPASVMTSVGSGVLPATHDYAEGSFDPDAGVLLGTGDENGVTFEHAMAYIAFVPQGDGTQITSLELTAIGGEKISGAFTTDYSTLTMSGEASSSLTVNCAAPIALGNEIIAAIPAQTYSQGFNLKFFDSDGGSMERLAAGAFPAAAGHIYTTRIPYVADPKSPDVIPTSIYLSGDPFNWGFGAENMRKLDDSDGDGIFEITCSLTYIWGIPENWDNAQPFHYEGFKIFGVNNDGEPDWDVAYGMCPSSKSVDHIRFDLVSNIGGDPQFYLKRLDPNFESGVYTITINFNTMKVSVVPATGATPDERYPYQLFMSGGFNGWSVVEMQKIAYGKFQLQDYYFNFFSSEDDSKGHGIKFFENSDWSNQWGPVQDWEHTEYRGWELASYGDAPQFYPQLAGFQSGYYTVDVDFTTKTVSLTPSACAYLYGAAFADYTDWVDWIPVPSVAENVYETTLNLNVGDASYARGFKVYKGIEDWGSEHCMYSDSTHDNIKIGLKDATGDNQVIPFNVGYTESGNYVVRIDFNTMTVTLTKAN